MGLNSKFKIQNSKLLVIFLLLSLWLAGCSETRPTGQATTTTGAPTATATKLSEIPAPSTLSPAVQATLIAIAEITEAASGPPILPPGAIAIDGTPTPTPTIAPLPITAMAFTDWSQLPAPEGEPKLARLIGQINSQVAAVPTPSVIGSPASNKKAPLTALAISPDNNIVAIADREQIWLCDAVTGRALQVIYAPSNPNFAGRPGESEERGAASLAWSSDGKKLAAGGWHGQVSLWRWEAAQKRVRPGRNVLQPYAGASFFGDAVEVAFQPKGDLLAGFSASGSITVWDSETLQTRSTFYSPYAGYMSWSPDGKRLVDEYLNLHDLEVGQSFYPGEKAIVSDEQPQGIAWSPDGKQLAVSADGFELGLVDAPAPGKGRFVEGELKKIVRSRTTTGPAYDHFREGRRVAWSPDNKWVAVANMPAAGTISVWDNSGRKLFTISSGSEILTGLAWPTSATIVAAGYDGITRFWQLISPPPITPAP